MAVQTYVQAIRMYKDMQVDELVKIEAFNKELGKAGKTAAEEGLAALKKINDHLAAAREHANTWDLLVEDIFKVNADVRKIAGDVERICKETKGKVTAVRNGTEAEMKAALEHARGGLLTIEGVAKSRAKSSEDLASSLDTFKNKVAQDHRDFSADSARVTAVITGDQSWIKSIEGEVSALHDAIKKDTIMIAAGSTGIAAGVITGIIGGVLIATGVGTGIGLIVIGAGVAIAVGGSIVTAIGKIDLDKKKAAMAADERKLSLLKGSVATFRNAEQMVSALAERAAEAAAGAQQLSLAWKDMAANLQSAAQAIDEVIKVPNNFDNVKDMLDSTAFLLDGAVDSWGPVKKMTDDIDKGMKGVKDPSKVEKRIDTVTLAA
ncbi:HBL/NHE enterotoxin family protein [Streptomyces diastatochromogenes]|uniref:HBL/NHE enterotoxin family protein n=1 Tax=Streptomyces diastatochromogenes TaxID=42236 RepID=UPI002F26A68F